MWTAEWFAALVLPFALGAQTGGGATNASRAAGPCAKPEAATAHAWSMKPEDGGGAAPNNLAGSLVAREPATVTEPLEFGGPSAARFPLISMRAFSWTSVLFTLDGMNVTDPYQPGRILIPLDSPLVNEAVVCAGFDLGASRAYGSEIAAFSEEPQRALHGEASATGTASGLAGDNLPAPGARGLLQQPAKYLGYSNNGIQAGGAAGHRVDWLASATGGWSRQTVPLASPGSDFGSLAFSGFATIRAQLINKDQLYLRAGGARARLSDWAMPAGIEAWVGRRDAPSFTIPSLEGFPGTSESDDSRYFQAAWFRLASRGAWRLRFDASLANLDAASPAQAGAQSRIDLVTGLTNGVAPLANQANRNRQGAAASYDRKPIQSGKSRHVFGAGAEWGRAGIGNQYSAPSNMNLITADGAPAFVVMLNTPALSRESVRNFTAFARDAITIGSGLSFDADVMAESARGGPIAWNSVSPRAGFAFAPHALHGIALRGAYARLYAPLAGRYLDFANANSLGGLEYQWNDRNHDGLYQPGEMGPLLMAFGGPYSSVDPAIRRPYADEFNVGADASLPRNIFARAWFFRRDDKRRIAAIDTGVPMSSYNAVTITDPGPDGIPGTFDDRPLTVYAQSPATFGKDRYLLTNPEGFRTLGEGMVSEAGARWSAYSAHASFMAVKSYGPSNPGNSPLENDPGVVGVLGSDPNASINAWGRQFFDRAYVGKFQLTGKLPRAVGGIEFASAVNYLDGVAFARRLLVTSLPQGPVSIDATVRGSPGGGNRSEHVMNWNLRLSRALAPRHGNARIALDLVNAVNSDNRIQESESSGTQFNLRLPIATEPARFLRIMVVYGF